MSRIGKQPVTLPKGVTVSVGEHNLLTVKGPKGELKQSIDRDITVEVKDDHVYFSRPTDQIRHRADGQIELLGRDSVTVNSGGEKIFVEEVERAIAGHPAVADVVVTGRPSERWGQEVVAVVQLADDASADQASIIEEASAHIARYKLPKEVVFVELIQRSPSGKADYRWAAETAVSAAATGN